MYACVGWVQCKEYVIANMSKGAKILRINLVHVETLLQTSDFNRYILNAMNMAASMWVNELVNNMFPRSVIIA